MPRQTQRRLSRASRPRLGRLWDVVLRHRSACSYQHSFIGFLGGLGQHRLENAVYGEIGITADGRGEVGVGGGGQSEVSFVGFRVARLAERAQHEVGENALLRLAFQFLGQLLVHARDDVHVSRDFHFAGLAAGAAAGAALAARAKAIDGQRPHAERIAEGGGNGFKVEHALGRRACDGRGRAKRCACLPGSWPRIRWRPA